RTCGGSNCRKAALSVELRAEACRVTERRPGHPWFPWDVLPSANARYPSARSRLRWLRRASSAGRGLPRWPFLLRYITPASSIGFEPAGRSLSPCLARRQSTPSRHACGLDANTPRHRLHGLLKEGTVFCRRPGRSRNKRNRSFRGLGRELLALDHENES